MRIVAIAAAILLTSCVRSAVVECGDAVICAEGRVCASENRCVAPEQVAACAGVEHGSPCTAGALLGLCDDGVCVEPDVPRWQQVTSPWRARYRHVVTFDAARGQLVLFGGAVPAATSGSDAGAVSDTWVRDVDGDTWQQLPIVGPGPRAGATMAYDSARQRSVLFGGGQLNDTWEFDGTAWTQRSPTTSPPARGLASMTYDPVRQRVVLAGGYTAAGMKLRDHWEWDGTTWSQRGNIPYEVFDEGLCYDVARQRLVLAFGSGLPALLFELPDGSSTWQSIPGVAPIARSGATMTYVPGYGCVMFGGLGPTMLNDTWAWNGTAWTQFASPVSPAPRAYHSFTHFAVNGTDRVAMVGGAPDVGGADLDDVWDLTLQSGGAATWSRRDPRVYPTSRARTPMIYDRARKELVIYSGRINPFLQDTWVFDGTSWSERKPMTKPFSPERPANGRFDHALAYDPTGERVVLFGGTITALGRSLADTWTWNGADWTKLDGVGPAGRLRPSMSEDPSSGNVILFGGITYEGMTFVDTWELVGSTWTQVPTQAAPPPAGLAQPIGADPDRGRVVLLARDGTTWAYANREWSQLDIPIEPRLVDRTSTSLVFDRVRHTMVLFGGAVRGTPFHDLWELAETGWQEITVAGEAPPALEGNAIGYHDATLTLVTFGGQLAGTADYNETWILRPVLAD